MTSPNIQGARMPQVGEKAPEFTLSTFPEGKFSLSEAHGKKNVILAFYPKDNTPGCTKEMCSFNEDLSKFESADTEVFGISCDSVTSHSNFAAKFDLKQRLLADDERTVANLYGVMREGKTTAARVLFVIDKQGVIQEVVDGMPDNAKLLELLAKI